MANEIQEFYYQIPLVTRTLLTVSGAIAIMTTLHIVGVTHFVNFWPYVYGRLHLWRPFTAFVTPAGDPMKVMFDLYILYTNSNRLETSHFHGSTKEYVRFLAFNAAVILLANVYLKGALYLQPLMMAMTYTTAQDHPEEPTTFYFFTLRAKFLPALMIFVSLLMGGPEGALQAVTGYLSGHLYLYLFTLLPAHIGSRRSGGNRVGGGAKPRPRGIVYLTDRNFAQETAGKDAIVSFSTTWCGHCQRMKPDYEQLANTAPPGVVVAIADCTGSGATQLAQKYDVRGFPTILFFPADGSPHVQFEGERTLSAFRSFVNRHRTATRAGSSQARSWGNVHRLWSDDTGSSSSRSSGFQGKGHRLGSG